MQAGGRRFDPVWLHQTVVIVTAAANAIKLVREKTKSARPRHMARRKTGGEARVLSDIVKRRSTQALPRDVSHRPRAIPFRDRETGIGDRKEF